MVYDPYKAKECFEAWKADVLKEGIDGINKSNSDLILKYISDMELGQNTARSHKKGGRSFKRLNALRIRMRWIAKQLELRNINDISKLNPKQIILFFNDMEKGTIKKKDGHKFNSVVDYKKCFKAFWHWYIKINRTKGKEIEDITQDLDTNSKESNFVYFTKDDMEKMMPYFSKDEQVRLLFMYDTIIRSPTELMNIKISDLSPDCKTLSIRDEAAKTFGRTIKILLCSKELNEYIRRNDFKDDDFLFKFSYPLFNDKIKRIAAQVFGDKMTKGGQRYSEMTCYDFRHSGAIYWRLGAYKSKIDALMYRGGWSNLEILNYYTKKIGCKDSIEEQDLLIEADKSKMQMEIESLKKDISVLIESKTVIDKIINNLARNSQTKKLLAKGLIKSNMVKEVINCGR